MSTEEELNMELCDKTLIYEQVLDNGKARLAILFGGQNVDSPKGFMDKVVREYVGHEEYLDFIDISLCEPRLRVIIKGINEIDFKEYSKNIHSLTECAIRDNDKKFEMKNENNNIDWNRVLIDASISAMQGIQESGKVGLISDIVPEELAKLSIKIGKAMISELKKETTNRDNTVNQKYRFLSDMARDIIADIQSSEEKLHEIEKASFKIIKEYFEKIKSEGKLIRDCYLLLPNNFYPKINAIYLDEDKIGFVSLDKENNVIQEIESHMVKNYELELSTIADEIRTEEKSTDYTDPKLFDFNIMQHLCED